MEEGGLSSKRVEGETSLKFEMSDEKVDRFRKIEISCIPEGGTLTIRVKD